MKFVMMFVFLIASNAYGINLTCYKEVSKSRTEDTQVKTTFRVYISRGFSECVDVGGSISCDVGIREDLVNDRSVCFSRVDTRKNCTVKESGSYSTGYSLEIKCVNGVGLNLYTDLNQNGYAFCVNNNQSFQWDLGACIPSN